MNIFRRSFAFVLATTALLSLGAQAQTPPKVDGAWARPTVAGQTAGGGYVTIHGTGVPDRLLSARSDVAQTVELHSMTMDGDVMRMRRVDGIDVPAGQKVELKPGGLHVMFIGLTQPLQVGSSFPLTLRFKEGGDVKVDVKVMTAPSAATGAHKH